MTSPRVRLVVLCIATVAVMVAVFAIRFRYHEQREDSGNDLQSTIQSLALEKGSRVENLRRLERLALESPLEDTRAAACEQFAKYSSPSPEARGLLATVAIRDRSERNRIAAFAMFLAMAPAPEEMTRLFKTIPTEEGRQRVLAFIATRDREYIIECQAALTAAARSDDPLTIVLAIQAMLQASPMPSSFRNEISRGYP